MATIFIKNMVCPRCLSSVAGILRENGLAYTGIRLGEVELTVVPTAEARNGLAASLQEAGFELLDDARTQQIEKVKNLLIQKIQQGTIEEHFSLSRFLSAALLKDYSHVSKLFSEVEGITIEQFFILQKIEKAKEWLVYNDQPVNEIAFNLGYSSVQHLSNQFRKVTGLTPSSFRKIGADRRIALDAVGKGAPP